MRLYIATSGVLFALVFAAHLARIYVEGTRLLQDPAWVSLTLLVLAMAIWSLTLIRATGRTPRPRP